MCNTTGWYFALRLSRMVVCPLLFDAAAAPCRPLRRVFGPIQSEQDSRRPC